MPGAQESIEVLCIQPDLSQRGIDVVLGVAAPEGDEPDFIALVELQNSAAVIERLISIGAQTIW